ncbi:putative ribonuclease H-like domain-containing protein [Tanacetum coccineum]
MNQFCEMKGILRQFSVARTPQQDGVAERRNGTLIEVKRRKETEPSQRITFCYHYGQQIYHFSQDLNILHDDVSKPSSDNVKKQKRCIFINKDKYVGEILKKFGFTEVKTASTPMETQKPLLKDEDGKEVDVHMYRSNDWFICKKQTVVANSTTEADLVRVATTASSLEAKQDSGNIAKTQSKATPNESSSLGTTSGGGPKRQETIGDTITQTSLRIIDLVEGSSKQAGDKLEQEVTKKQKVDDVYETTEVDDDSEAAKIKELNWKLFPDEEEK